MDDNIYASPRGLCTLAKECTAATRIMQSSSNELSTLVSGKAKTIMPYNSWADVVRLLSKRHDTKSNVNFGGFRSQLQASYVSSHTEELWYNESLTVDDNKHTHTHTHTHTHIYIYIKDLALNNLEYLICHKTQPNKIILYLIYMYKQNLALNNLQWLICHKT